MCGCGADNYKRDGKNAWRDWLLGRFEDVYVSFRFDDSRTIS